MTMEIPTLKHLAMPSSAWPAIPDPLRPSMITVLLWFNRDIEMLFNQIMEAYQGLLTKVHQHCHSKILNYTQVSSCQRLPAKQLGRLKHPPAQALVEVPRMVQSVPQHCSRQHCWPGRRLATLRSWNSRKLLSYLKKIFKVYPLVN